LAEPQPEKAQRAFERSMPFRACQDADGRGATEALLLNIPAALR
jgi:hypothetical protein